MPTLNRFEYFCGNCGAPAKKPALKNKRDWKGLDPKDFDGLGTWHCAGACRGKVKVRRVSLQRRAEALEQAA